MQASLPSVENWQTLVPRYLSRSALSDSRRSSLDLLGASPCSRRRPRSIVIHSRTVVILWRATSSEVKILSLKTRWFRVIHNCQHIQGRILTETPDGGRQMVFREASRAAAKFCWTARWTVFLRARSLLKPLLWRFSPRVQRATWVWRVAYSHGWLVSGLNRVNSGLNRVNSGLEWLPDKCILHSLLTKPHTLNFSWEVR